ncbi:hypothetical protein BAUCODRAFT_264092 [Baudoinia panamericana UAMH 10762]|uniref:DNA-directed RNA polymerase III subunit n=1 Tax=Baudoinia panamericana (strain UAMH 10762) TaxID=717646 RepID=M2N2E1_BAUPA|nr:uncharacterized protein BAUCODRAFT_264092 [Baudoinia panamericana UAMH 10762]EMC92840.1 hypothetical protein BAUCODRAFT_264092 [Baudoinia panamericana UAMH 10762]
MSSGVLYSGGVPKAAPPTNREKKLVQIYREIIAEKHAGPAYSGPPGSMKILCNKRTAADFDPFEEQSTYGKKYERKTFRLADPKKRKWQAPHLFPKELWETIGYNPDASEDEQPARKKLVLNRRTNLDKLARFDEDAEERGVNGEANEDAEDEANDDEDEENRPQGLRDDVFDEDEDDDADDYNAEQYFDDGADDYDEAGGDEYGADDGY